MQRYSLVAFSFLALTIVLVIAISLDPKGFVLKEWQPLIASLFALGGAAIVYRGATLAYRASMAKVALDERVHETNIRRVRRGIYLRLLSEVHTIRDEIVSLKRKLDIPTQTGQKIIRQPADLSPSESTRLAEAWQNLDLFSSQQVRAISNARIDLNNVAALLRSSAPIELKSGEPLPPRAKRLLESYESFLNVTEPLYNFLLNELDDGS